MNATKIFAYFLVILMVFPMMAKVFIITDFSINRDEIAKTICINKVKIPLCQGSCVLNERLGKVNENSQLPESKRSVLNFDTYECVLADHYTSKHGFVINTKETHGFLVPVYKYLDYKSAKKPPEAIS